MKDKNFAGNSESAIDFLGKKWNYECMGCAISNGDIKIPGGIIYEGKHTLLGADPIIPIPGFLIVNVKRHVNSFSQLDKEERYEIVNVISYAEKALKELHITEEVTLVQEERSKHLHVWIFPNYKWMTEKFGKGIKYLRDISEYAKKNVNENNIKEILNTIEKIRKYFEEQAFGDTYQKL
ncbi:MAG: HIT family hydrolase [Clostridia bacterium]|nr:HIT family hydrolase [Clostridia bacterium]